jgi:hypothetical protein
VDITGVDTTALLAAFQRHPAAAQWILAGATARANDGWTRRPYDGTDPGPGRLHLGIGATETAERDQRPWGLIGEDGMDAKQFLALLKDPAVATQLRALPWQYTGGGIPKGMSTLGVLNELVQKVRVLSDVVARQSADPAGVRAMLADLPTPRADVEALANPTAPRVDVDTLADVIAARVLAALPDDGRGLSQEKLTEALRTALTEPPHEPAGPAG